MRVDMSAVTGKFPIIVMDPPWFFAANSEAKPGKGARRHYPVMRDDEIRAMPVADLSERDAILFMWTTAPMMRRAIDVPESWGFRYVSQFVWPKNRAVTGFWVRNQHEIVCLYRRGKFRRPDMKAPFSSSLLLGAQAEHSRKPGHLQDQIDGIWPDLPKLEMFARTQRPGWTAWGNQTDRFSA